MAVHENLVQHKIDNTRYHRGAAISFIAGSNAAVRACRVLPKTSLNVLFPFPAAWRSCLPIRA